jgi:hypothetical protein
MVDGHSDLSQSLSGADVCLRWIRLTEEMSFKKALMERTNSKSNEFKTLLLVTIDVLASNYIMTAL